VTGGRSKVLPSGNGIGNGNGNGIGHGNGHGNGHDGVGELSPSNGV
jgi:hypothetical protein